MRGPVLRRRLAACLLGALLVAALGGSLAAFSATTANPGNSLDAGTVILTDDDVGAAMVTAPGLKPGTSGSRCLVLSYGGSLAATIRLYASAVSGSLAPYLRMELEAGTGGTNGSCTGFAPQQRFFDDTITQLGTSTISWSTGVGNWGPSGPGQSRTVRLTWTLDANAPNGTQGGSGSVNLTWEGRSRDDPDAVLPDQAVLADNPVNVYRLNGPSTTTVVDELGVGNGTWVGTPTFGAPGVTGDGNMGWRQSGGVRAEVPRQVSDDFTLEAWFRTSSTAGATGTGNPWYTNSPAAGLVDAETFDIVNDFGSTIQGDGRVLAGIGNPDITIRSGPGYNDGRWHHFAMTRVRSSGVFRLYLDGAEVASATGQTGALTAPGAIRLGANTGDVDEAAIYPTALSAARVLAHYRAGR